MRRSSSIPCAVVFLLANLTHTVSIHADPPTTQPAVSLAVEYVPGKHWDQPTSPEALGWSANKLKEANTYSESINSAGVFIVHRGHLVAEWGETDRRMNVHSIRKSLLSAMYGRYIEEGKIHPGDSMAKLGIDDIPPSLSAVEKQATVSDLLRARSGVYHLAAYETASMKDARPQRFSHAPGTFWYYNNWDFNVLGTIFRQAVGRSVGAEFEERIARPLQMEDFRLEDATQSLEPESSHPAYPFRLTARDMARFGLLMLRNGRWGDQQIIAPDWVRESTRSYSAVRGPKGELLGGYGYMWWTSLGGRHLEGVDLPAGSFSARGAGGHYILIVPGLDLVIVHRAYSEGLVKKPVNRNQFGGLVKRILEAMPASEREHPTSRPAVDCWTPDVLDETLPRLMAQHKVPGVAIVSIENGRIAWERQYGVKAAGRPEAVDAQTVFEACSMSKLPFAYIALKLVEQGKLDLDRPLVEYLDTPYLPDEPRHKLITARMVLSHTTGLPNWREGGWDKGGPLKLICDPGTRFTYSGEGFLYLQRVIEHLTGTPMQTYMKQTLFDPLGITISSYVWEERFDKLAAAGHDANGQVKPNRPHYMKANAAFSLYCTPAEYATFILEILKADRSGAQSLSERSIAAMLARTTRADGRTSPHRSGPGKAEVSYYGLGWAIDPAPSGERIYHSGSNGTGFRCYCEYDRKSGAGLVIMTNAVNGDELWHDVLTAIDNAKATSAPGVTSSP